MVVAKRAAFRTLLLTGFLLAITSLAVAQPVYVYEGRTYDPNRIICNIWNGVVIEGEYQDMTMAVVRRDSEYIYAGGTNSTFDIVYTIRSNRIFEGESQFSGDIVCTIKGPHIYKGDSTFALDLAYTYRDGYIFEGDGMSMLDVVFTTDPPAKNMLDVAMFLLAMDLL